MYRTILCPCQGRHTGPVESQPGAVVRAKSECEPTNARKTGPANAATVGDDPGRPPMFMVRSLNMRSDTEGPQNCGPAARECSGGLAEPHWGLAEPHSGAAPIGRMLILGAGDNVAVVVAPVPRGGVLLANSGQRLESVDEVPRAHKIALDDLPETTGVRKYGELIGVTTRFVRRGEHVHVHNVESERLPGDLARPSAAPGVAHHDR
jgi:altronate dehydratase small subunit